MAILQGLRLVNKKDFMGQEGYGFNADLKMGSKTIGNVNDFADGSGMLVVYVQSEYRERYNEAIRTFHKKELENEDSLYAHLQSIYEAETETFFEYMLLISDIEKSAKKQLKEGRHFAVLLNFPKYIAGENMYDTSYGDTYVIPYAPQQEETVDKNARNFEKPYTHYLKFKSTKDFTIKH